MSETTTARNRAAIMAELARLSDEIETLTKDRSTLLIAAKQAGCSPTEVSRVTGLARSTILRLGL